MRKLSRLYGKRMRCWSDELPPRFVYLPTCRFRPLLLRPYCYFIVDSESVKRATITLKRCAKVLSMPQNSRMLRLMYAPINSRANCFYFSQFPLFNDWTFAVYHLYCLREAFRDNLGRGFIISMAGYKWCQHFFLAFPVPVVVIYFPKVIFCSCSA